MEAGAGVAKAVLAGAELAEVASGLGDDIVEELEDDAARRLVVDGDVKLPKSTSQSESNMRRWSVNMRSDAADRGQGRCRTHVDVGHGGLGDGGGEQERGSRKDLSGYIVIGLFELGIAFPIFPDQAKSTSPRQLS